MPQVSATIVNVTQLSYDDFAASIAGYYNLAPPKTIPSQEADDFFVFLPVAYGYLLGLWSVLDKAVRDDQDKSQMSKRDLCDRALGAIKLAYEATSRRLTMKTAMASLSGERTS